MAVTKGLLFSRADGLFRVVAENAAEGKTTFPRKVLTVSYWTLKRARGLNVGIRVWSSEVLDVSRPKYPKHAKTEISGGKKQSRKPRSVVGYRGS